MSAVPVESQFSRGQLFQVFGRPGYLTSRLFAPPEKPAGQLDSYNWPEFLDFLGKSPRILGYSFQKVDAFKGTNAHCLLTVHVENGYNLRTAALEYTKKNIYTGDLNLDDAFENPDGSSNYIYRLPPEFCPPGNPFGEPEVAPQGNPSQDNNFEFSFVQTTPSYRDSVKPELPSNWWTIGGGSVLAVLAFLAFIRSRFRLAYS